jgi:glutamate-ammonia-ligase adenylyltransferase
MSLAYRFAPHEIDDEAAERALEQARAAGVETTAPTTRLLVATLGAAGAAVLPALLRQPALAQTLGDELAAHDTIAPARCPPLAPRGSRETPDLDAVKRALRRTRDEALVRTALRELLAVVDVDATAREWSRVAACCTEHALAAAEDATEARNGPPLDDKGERCVFTVLGMGKLGGAELNLGSDIDICFFYATDEGAAGTRTLNQHFSRVGTTLFDLLGDVTADGFAFRVDLRLRPEGSRGPVANSLASAERYYETWGRTWERAALLRATPIAGDLAFGRALMDVLYPFIFRRQVDPGVAVELAAMLERARREQLRDDARDLKLGRGGIREAEFFVQSLQLVWGGRHPSLQVPGTLDALQRLHALGLVSNRDARDLDDAWGLLRRVEHRVQVMTPYATHEVPRELARLEALARSLGYARGEALIEALDEARAHVRTLFDSLTPRETRPSALVPSPETLLADAIASGRDTAEILEPIADVLGARDPEGAARNLTRLARQAEMPFSPGLRAREPELAPRLLAEIRDAPDPDMALLHLAAFFERVRPAERYARVLIEHPARARGLIGLFGASEHIARTILAHPEFIDGVVSGGGAPDVDELNAWLDTAFARGREAHGDDTEAVVGTMRTVAQEATLAVALADMAGTLTVPEVTRRLSAIAEASVRNALALAAEECAAKYGSPGDRADENIAAVALGSLAARELGYGGDLDLLFVYARDGETRGGTRSAVTVAEYSARLAQRALRILSMPHEAGPGYSTDTRLRPSGSQGTLVTSREAFERYHATSAASWERQALLRARPVAGDASFGRAMHAVIQSVAYERGPADIAELRRLRARMELELGREDRGEVAIKYGRGGLVDVEFAAQALQMAHGHDPRVRHAATRDAIESLRAADYVTPHRAEALLDAERLLRRALLAARLTTLRGGLVPSSPAAVTVARRLGYRDRADATALEGLLADIANTRDTVRKTSREILNALERASSPGPATP